MDDNILVHGTAVLEEYDRGDLFSSELERKLTSVVCNLCSDSSPDLERWRLHCISRHTSVPGYSPARLSTGLSPTPDLFTAGPGKNVKCPECGRMFSSDFEMREHLVSQMRSVRLVCGQCGAHWPDLESHFLSDHSQDTTCSICGQEHLQDLLDHHHKQHQGFASVIAETEVRCAGDGVTVEYFQTVLATKARFLATEVKPETETNIKTEVDVPKEESLPRITRVIGSYPQSQSQITSEEERNSYNVLCYEKLHSSSNNWKMGLGRNCCEICGFVPYTKNKYREKQDHLAKLHFKERIDGLLPSCSPYICPASLCQYRGKDRQDIQRHYTGKHNILKMWVDTFLKQQDGVLDSTQIDNSDSSGLGRKKSEWEMTFKEMELVAIQKETSRKRRENKKSLVDDIKSEIDLSNSSLTISTISCVKDHGPIIEAPPSISLIRIEKKDSPAPDDCPASRASSSSTLQSTLSFKHLCVQCGMSFPTENNKKLHLEVCQDPDQVTMLQPPKKKKRPPPPLIPL